ncbi:bacteriorhodopsin [Spirosoma sp. KNUC1025]|uniref:bacteriorhodopsin n=1 Tax=Spirosoma sp. KNUC1025 TaxID=2894082 RepID=UPI00386F8813|nr:bacteriorhodopsin [Spirosoma sp. KNUC1025]
MEVSNMFIPTAGAVGLLPMVTYFFLVVALFVFAGNFIFGLASLPTIRAERRMTSTLTIVVSAIAGLSYYLIQAYYRDMLADLAAVPNDIDRQTLIRESYNAIGQYRYIDWFISAPLLLIQVISVLNWRLADSKRMLTGLLMSASFLFFAAYIGHQQLSFDNEIQVGQKVIWGLLATIDYVFVFFTLNRLGKQADGQTTPESLRVYRLLVLTIITCWGIHLLGYFLTVLQVDFNWIHLIFTITDLISQVGIGIAIYVVSTQSQD